jgi:hypothetical protein
MKIITTTHQDTRRGVREAWSGATLCGGDLRQALARKLCMQDFREMVPGVTISHCKKLSALDILIEDDLLNADPEVLGEEIAGLVKDWKAGELEPVAPDDLTTIDKVGEAKAAKLAEAGFDTFETLRGAPEAAIKSLKLGATTTQAVLDWQKQEKKRMDKSEGYENKSERHPRASKSAPPPNIKDKDKEDTDANAQRARGHP